MAVSLAGACVILRMTVVIVLTGILAAPAMAEPCNPVIDGTYCATDMTRRPDVSRSGSRFAPVQGIARDVGPWSDQPATLGGITFRGSETCIGLLRRGACN